MIQIHGILTDDLRLLKDKFITMPDQSKWTAQVIQVIDLALSNHDPNCEVCYVEVPDVAHTKPQAQPRPQGNRVRPVQRVQRPVPVRHHRGTPQP